MSDAGQHHSSNPGPVDRQSETVVLPAAGTPQGKAERQASPVRPHQAQTVRDVRFPHDTEMLPREPGTLPLVDAEPAPPKIRYFGDYELLGELARGGMGVVYKARQVNLNRLVALKMILAGKLAGAHDVERFLTEAKAAAQLDHPGIVPIFEVGEHEGHHFFSMGFVDGRSLAQRVTEGPLPPRGAAELLLDVARAVQYAHQRGVIHRDLKPGNILLDAHDRPRVTDFGVAKLTEGRSDITGTGQILGTPSYMPPEQAAGKMDQIGPPADVYALGAILYCLLTGRPPFQTASAMDTLRQVIDQEPVPVRQLIGQTPIDLETITLKCLEKDPTRRYSTASELADELQRFLNHEPIVARPVSRIERGWRWCRRNPGLAGLTGAVAVSLIAGTIISSYFAVLAASRANEKAKLADANARLAASEGVARARAQEKELLANDRLWQSLFEQSRAERLLGNRARALEIIAEAARTRTTPELRREAIESLTLPGIQLRHEISFGHACTLKFSSDGSQLLIHGKFGFGPDAKPADAPDDDVWMLVGWELPSGRLVASKLLPQATDDLGLGLSALVPGTGVQHAPFAISPRAGWAAICSHADDNIQLWDLASDKLAATIDASARGPVVFSADGKFVAAMAKDGASETRVWNVEQGQTEGGSLPGQPLAFIATDELLVIDEQCDCLRRVNFRTGQVVSSTPDHLSPVVVSQNGHTAALSRISAQGNEADPLVIWDVSANAELITLPLAARGKYGSSYETQFSQDGRLLAFHESPEPNSIKIWDRTTNTIKASFPGVVSAEGDWSQYQTAAFSPSGRLLVSYVRTRTDTLQVWDLENQRSCGLLHGNHSPTWSPDGRWLATIGPGQSERPDGTKYHGDRTLVRIWEVTNPTPRAALASRIDVLSFDPTGQQLAVNDNLVDVWSIATQPELQVRSQAPMGDLLAFDSAGRLRSVDFDFKGESWPPKHSDIKLSVPEQPDRYVSHADVPPSPALPGQICVGLSSEWKLVGCDQDGKWLAMFSLAWWNTPRADGEVHPTRNNNGCLAAWNLTRDQKLPAWQIFLEYSINVPSCLAISPDGRQLATGNSRGIQFWELATGRRLGTFECARKWTSSEKLDEGWTNWSQQSDGLFEYTNHFAVHQIRFGSDASRIYAATDDGRIYVGDVATARELAVWQGHQGRVLGLAIDSAGKLLASGGEDRTIRLWDVSAGTEIACWEAHRSDVTAVSFSGDGQWLASGSAEGAVKLWNVEKIRQGLLDLGF